MAADYYYSIFGQEFGPVEFDELKELASTGLIAPTDKIRRGTTGWAVADSVGELDFADIYSASVKPCQASTMVDVCLSRAKAEYVAAEQSACEQISWATQPNIDPSWWACVGGFWYGPIAFATIFEWVSTGRLAAGDLIKNGFYGQFVPAGNVPGLFAAVTILANAMKSLQEAEEAAKAQVQAEMPLENKPMVPAVAKVEAAPFSTAPKTAVASAKPVETIAVVTPLKPVQERPSAAVAVESAGASIVSTMPSISDGRSMAPRPAFSAKRAASSQESTLSSLLELVRNSRLIGGTAIAALALAAVLFTQPSSAQDIKRFHDLQQILNEVRSARAAGTKDFESLKTRAKKIAESYAAVYKREANNSYPAKQALLFAVRDEIPKMISGDLTTESKFEKNLELRLKDAAAMLGID